MFSQIHNVEQGVCDVAVMFAKMENGVTLM